MSQHVPKNHVIDKELFNEKLRQETALLKRWFEEQNFTRGNLQLGAEVEYLLVDDSMNITNNNKEIMRHISQPNFIPEVDTCSLESNTLPVNVNKSALSDLKKNIEYDLNIAQNAANTEKTHALCIGNCPTSTENDLTRNTVSDRVRCHLIQEYLIQGGKPFNIEMSESINIEADTITLITAAYQIHLRVGVRSSVKYFNAAVAGSAPVLAMATNSPIFFGKPLWHDSRVLYFEKLFFAVKDRSPNSWTRCEFPRHYLSDSWYEIYAENLEHFPVGLPIVNTNSANPIEHVQIQNGTRYPWVRTIIDFAGEGTPHLRIEYRPLSCGPTVLDMIANTAFFVGLTHALMKREEELTPYQDAKNNFYQAAKNGLGATINWHEQKNINVCELVENVFLPMAKEGLIDCGISEKDSEFYLNIILQRAIKNQNGSSWQLASLKKNGGDTHQMLREYLQRQNSGIPVHEWAL